MKYLDQSGLGHLVSKMRANIAIIENTYTYTTTSAMTVSFTVPAYTTDGKSTLDVYINGLYAVPTVDYTLSGNKVTLTNELETGQTVYFVVRTISI